MLINGIHYERGLIIDSPWIGYILTGIKTWEMRKTKTKVRGRIALIQKGTGTVVGTADLTDSLEPLSDTELASTFNYHQVDYSCTPEAKAWVTPWVLDNVTKLDTPIPYTHKQGAVIWVKI
ncbi:ASCH domain-containing protein [Vibrio chagasii]|nr:ASCH domain-containing protein [Vibrio chagasii]